MALPRSPRPPATSPPANCPPANSSLPESSPDNTCTHLLQLPLLQLQVAYLVKELWRGCSATATPNIPGADKVGRVKRPRLKLRRFGGLGGLGA